MCPFLWLLCSSCAAPAPLMLPYTHMAANLQNSRCAQSLPAPDGAHSSAGPKDTFLKGLGFRVLDLSV